MNLENFRKPVGIDPLDYKAEPNALRHIDETIQMVEFAYLVDGVSGEFRKRQKDDVNTAQDIYVSKNLRDQNLPAIVILPDLLNGDYVVFGERKALILHESVRDNLIFYERELGKSHKYTPEQIENLVGELFYRLTNAAHRVMGEIANPKILSLRQKLWK